ncbi:MAG: flavodoxin domain-containing protein [Planctomycetota bacterium]
MQVVVLYGTESGNSEECADRLAATLTAAGIPASSIDMASYPADQLAREAVALIVTSTYGNGDPPTNARELLSHVLSESTVLTGVRYGVCALGDSTYPRFAQCGRDFDESMELRGATRVIERVECDGEFDFEAPFEEFQARAVAYLEAEWPAISAGGKSVPSPAREGETC